jgi:molecular chaperone DnaK
MSKMINFAIDLGTTNSLIAKFDRGQVEVYKNPNGFKETLPSVVGFRNDRTLIGDQVRRFAEKDPKNVASRFKRKMGTTEAIRIQSLNGSKTPVELSAYVLKELKSFVHSGESVEAAVITIPASFDTVQSNATKEAGLAAGFKQVVLLQEPIAASLAYANKEKSDGLRNSEWIVYDLGGGTFDVALVRILEGELTVVDHEGDNYLGGSDFDALLVEKVVAPEISRRGRFDDLLAQMKSESGRHSRLWNTLLNKAEEAKIELSARTSADIDLDLIDLKDDDGKTIDSLLTVTRSEFEGLIKDAVDDTAEMMRKILTRNSLQPGDLKFILMVGGSTYIPYVRKRIEELMGIPVNTAIDPTNAIVVGAAYFAGAREMKPDDGATKAPLNKHNIKIRISYNRTSQEAEETFMAKVEGNIAGLSYRIYSEDGAFDSGLKAVSNRIAEDLPLRLGAFNLFRFKILDAQSNPVDVGFDLIEIAQGRYSVAGQMLPDDICLVKDSLAKKDTILERVFPRNAVLPAKSQTIQVQAAKTITKNSDEEILIVVVEGPEEKHHTTNKRIGSLVISGKQLTRDLIKGSDIELSFQMSESRDLTVSALLTTTGQEFSQIFKPASRHVEPKLLARDILKLENQIQAEIDEADAKGNDEVTGRLNHLLSQVQDLIVESGGLSGDDVTDDRFKLEDKTRRVAQAMFDLGAPKRLDAAKVAYYEEKELTSAVVHEHGNDREKQKLREIFNREQAFIHSTNPERIGAETTNLGRIRFQILMRLPEFLVSMFEGLVERRVSMNDQAQAKQFIEHGRRLVQTQSWDDLRQVISCLWDLLPDANDDEASQYRLYTGIV